VLTAADGLSMFSVEQWSCPWWWTLSADNPQIKQTQNAEGCKVGSVAHTSAMRHPMLYAIMWHYLCSCCIELSVMQSFYNVFFTLISSARGFYPPNLDTKLGAFPPSFPLEVGPLESSYWVWGAPRARPPNTFWAEIKASGGISFNDFPEK